MSAQPETLAYSIAQAVAASGVSESTIRRAIRTTKPDEFPPPLQAHKRGSARNSSIFILAEDLRAWLRSFPDA